MRKKARKKVLEKYFSDQIEALEKEIENLEKEVGEETNIESTPIDVMDVQISSLNNKINKLIEDKTSKKVELGKIDDRLVEDNNLLGKYDILLSQYESDIRRMQLLIDGEANAESPERTVCPFCNSEMELDHNQSCSDAAEAEIGKILLKIKDLNEARDDLEKEIAQLSETRRTIADDIAEAEKEINELKPTLNDLNSEIRKYRDSVLKFCKLNEKREIQASCQNRRGMCFLLYYLD